ncbi:hypothetical protein Tco_1085383 [Tanacetum coccineum]
MYAEYNIKEKRRLKSVVDDQAEVLKVKEKEMEDLKSQLLLKEAEAAEAIRLCAEASKFETAEKSLQDEIRYLKERNAALEKEKGYKMTGLLIRFIESRRTSPARLREKVTVYENCMSQLDKFQDERMKEVDDKFDKLDVDVIEMALHLEGVFNPRPFLAKPLRPGAEYLSTLGATIRRAIEKVMQDGLAAGITHGQEVDVKLLLLAELRVRYKGASIDLNEHSPFEEPGLPNCPYGASRISAGMTASFPYVNKWGVAVTRYNHCRVP